MCALQLRALHPNSIMAVSPSVSHIWQHTLISHYHQILKFTSAIWWGWYQVLLSLIWKLTSISNNAMNLQPMTKYLQAADTLRIKIVFNLSDIWHTEVGAVLLLKDAFVVSLSLLTLWRGGGALSRCWCFSSICWRACCQLVVSGRSLLLVFVLNWMCCDKSWQN